MVNLQKGQKVNLVKESAGLTQVRVGLGWDEAQPQTKGFFASLFASKPQDIDCDASVILCGADGKVVGTSIRDCCVYFGNLHHASGAINHAGDNLTGGGEGDDEQITVDLPRIPANVQKLVFVVNIYDAAPRHQHFGMIRNAFIRLVDTRNEREICRYNLTEDYSGMTGLVVGELNRNGGQWEFDAIGRGVAQASRLDALINLYR
ncbi:MAG: TerD family protein [Clostridia bacterium]|nr:TerD family protein [Clostridia bacterium]